LLGGSSDASAQADEGLAPPEGWRELSPRAFTERTLAFGTAVRATPLTRAGRDELVQGLTEPGTSATRAAVLLAHAAAGGDGSAREALLVRLERRAHAPSRSEAAGDVVAAAALGDHAGTSGVASRLIDLCQGARPHPELDVRVECAVAALRAERDEVIPFLLGVLRAETPAESPDRDWPRVTTLAWPKMRAADALARRAGGSHTFRADASWADQMAAANALKTALRAAGAVR